MAAVRELFVSIGIVPNEQQFRKVEKRIADLRHGFFLLSAGVASVGAIIAKSLGEAASSADALDDLSQKTGVGTTALQELAYAAEQSGSSAEALNGSFAPLSRQMAEAAGGGKEAASAFKSLGVNIKNADGTLRPLEDVFMASADGIAAMKDDASRAAAAMKIFGRSGIELVPLLKNGSQAIADLRAEAEELGFVMDEGSVKAFAGFSDTGKRVKNVALGLSRAFAKGLLPNFQALFERLLAVNKASGETIRSKLEDWGRRLGEVFSRVDQVLISLGQAFRAVFGIIGQMPGIIQGALAAIALFALVMFSPAVGIALLIALIIALIDEFRAFNDGAENIFDELFAMMPEWLNNIVAFVMAIFAPFLDPAAWKAVVDYWQESLFALFTVIEEVWGVISTFWGDALFALFDGAKSGINVITTFLEDTFNEWLSGVENVFKAIGDIVGKGLAVFEKVKGVFTGGTFGIGGTVDQQISGAFGNGAAPTAGATTNTGGTTVNAPATNTFTINAAPGMNSKDVANDVAATLNSSTQDQLRATFVQLGGQ